MNKARVVIAILFVAILCFVWGNSLLPPELSAEISTAVGNFFAKIFGSGDGATITGGLSVRKTAHFVEFCALGAVTSLLLRTFVSSWRLRLNIEIIVGILIPVIDETIQIFSGRGSSVRDVWIDMGGYAFGCAMVYFILFIKKKIKSKGEKRL